MIISVGYRVNSICGTKFRRWANQVLKEHLLKGGSVNQRLISHENKLENLDARMHTLEKNVEQKRTRVGPYVLLLRFNRFRL